jgi:type IV pilus assembly protein PilE
MKNRYPSRTGGRARPGPAAGFTLIELMIAMVVAAILLSIAIPIYLHQIREARRTDARTALLDLAEREQRYYATNDAYTNVASNLGYAGWGSGNPVGNGGYYYLDTPDLTCPAGTTGSCFKLEAQPVAGQGQDQDSTCQAFFVDQTGQQTAQDSSNNDQSATCWGQ